MLLSAGSQNIGAFARPLLPSCLPAGGGSAGACIVWFTTAEGGAFYCVAKQYMGLSMFCLPTVGSWRVPHTLQRCQARGQPPVCSQRYRPQGVQEDTESGKWASQLLPPKGVNAQGATSDKIVSCRNNARMKLKKFKILTLVARIVWVHFLWFLLILRKDSLTRHDKRQFCRSRCRSLCVHTLMRFVLTKVRDRATLRCCAGSRLGKRLNGGKRTNRQLGSCV